MRSCCRHPSCNRTAGRPGGPRRPLRLRLAGHRITGPPLRAARQRETRSRRDGDGPGDGRLWPRRLAWPPQSACRSCCLRGRPVAACWRTGSVRLTAASGIGRNLALPDPPGAAVAADGSVWVTSPEGNVVYRIDPVTASVVQTIPVGVGPQRDHRRGPRHLGGQHPGRHRVPDQRGRRRGRPDRQRRRRAYRDRRRRRVGLGGRRRGQHPVGAQPCLRTADLHGRRCRRRRSGSPSAPARCGSPARRQQRYPGRSAQRAAGPADPRRCRAHGHRLRLWFSVGGQRARQHGLPR